MSLSTRRTGGLRALRGHIRSILKLPWDQAVKELKAFPSPKVLISPLRSFFMDGDQLTRWRAISAFALATSWIAERDLEQARIIMRQLMWTLNDESGGIGWGSPEAMGESMALTPSLAIEYGKILLSYIWEDGNFLEYDALRLGALWGIMRASSRQTEIMMSHDAPRFLVPYLDDSDETAVALSSLTLRSLGHVDEVEEALARKGLKGHSLSIYMDGYFLEITL